TLSSHRRMSESDRKRRLMTRLPDPAGSREPNRPAAEFDAVKRRTPALAGLSRLRQDYIEGNDTERGLRFYCQRGGDRLDVQCNWFRVLPRMFCEKASAMTDLTGVTPESWNCIDCGINTWPGCPSRIEMERRYKASKAGKALSATGEELPLASLTV